jgi:hypothetical protein
MKRLLIFALMLFSYFGYSQEWTYVGMSKDLKVYIAKNYVSNNDGIITVWVKHVKNQPYLREDGTYESYTTYLDSFDCQNGSAGLRQIISYDKNGNIIYREIINREIEYRIDPPGSIGEITVQKVCSTFNKKRVEIKKK